MSMVLLIRKVSDEKLKALHQKPEDIIWFLTGEELKEKPSFIQGLSHSIGTKKHPTPSEEHRDEWIEPEEEEEEYLDKAWHGIHFLLTGTAYGGSPPSSYLLTGKEIGDIDVGYGPAMSLTSDEVKEFNSYLQGISTETLKENYSPKKMKELGIYPDVYFSVEEDSGPLAYLLGYFNILKEFVSNTANANSALILYLT